MKFAFYSPISGATQNKADCSSKTMASTIFFCSPITWPQAPPNFKSFWISPVSFDPWTPAYFRCPIMRKCGCPVSDPSSQKEKQAKAQVWNKHIPVLETFWKEQGQETPGHKQPLPNFQPLHFSACRGSPWWQFFPSNLDESLKFRVVQVVCAWHSSSFLQ